MRSSMFLGFLVGGLGLSSPLGFPRALNGSSSRAAYLLQNDPEGNYILSLDIDETSGFVGNPIKTSTGGKGLLATNGPDSLVSQGAVEVSRDYLFTVNAGSNTISMFSINPYSPTYLSLIAQTDTLGQFPSSVTYSDRLKKACVLNGGAIAGVTCFNVDPKRGLIPDGGIRSLNKALNQTTPLTALPFGNDTASDITFNPSSTGLFATIKGGGNGGVTPGFIYAWQVENRTISSEPVISSPPTIILDFSLNFLGSDTRGLITGVFDTSIVAVSPDLKVTVTQEVDIPAALGTCWGVYSPRFDSVYVIGGAQTNITIVDPSTGSIKGFIGFEPSGTPWSGGFDSAIDRNWLYTLTGDSTIAVIDLAGQDVGEVPKQVQSFDLGPLETSGHWQGMAVYPS